MLVGAYIFLLSALLLCVCLRLIKWHTIAFSMCFRIQIEYISFSCVCVSVCVCWFSFARLCIIVVPIFHLFRTFNWFILNRVYCFLLGFLSSVRSMFLCFSIFLMSFCIAVCFVVISKPFTAFTSKLPKNLGHFDRKNNIQQ